VQAVLVVIRFKAKAQIAEPGSIKHDKQWTETDDLGFAQITIK